MFLMMFPKFSMCFPKVFSITPHVPNDVPQVLNVFPKSVLHNTTCLSHTLLLKVLPFSLI